MVNILAPADVVYMNCFTHDPGIISWVVEACSLYVVSPDACSSAASAARIDVYVNLVDITDREVRFYGDSPLRIRLGTVVAGVRVGANDPHAIVAVGRAKTEATAPVTPVAKPCDSNLCRRRSGPAAHLR